MKNFNHVQIDIETLDTLPSAVILSIGAVFFDPMTGELGPEILLKIDQDKQPACRTKSKSTVDWWDNQSITAKEEAFSGEMHLSEALGHLNIFILEEAGEAACPWGNGSVFDITILEDGYRSCGLNGLIPWKFWNIRDCRTIEWAAKGLIDKKQIPKEGNHHKALDDAKHQAAYISVMYQKLVNCSMPAS